MEQYPSDKFSVERLDLSRLLPEEQFPFFADELSRRHVKLESTKIDDREDFPFKLIGLDAGSRNCTSIVSPPHRSVRDKSLVDREPSGDIHIVYAISGNTNIEHAGEQWQFGPGEFFIFNADIPFEAASTQPEKFAKFVVFGIPEQTQTGHPAVATGIHGTQLNQHPYSPLLKQTTQLLHRALESGDDVGAKHLFPVASSLVDFVISENLANEQLDMAEQSFHALHIEIYSSASNPDYAIEHAATSLKISARRVEQILNENNSTFGEFVADCRMARALQKLSDPQNAKLSIEELVRSTGFQSLDVFYEKLGREASKYFEEIRDIMNDKPSHPN